MPGKPSAKRRAGARTAKTTPARASRPSTGTKRTSPARPRLLSGGNPQVAKADGDAPVRAYIAAIPGWRRDVARRLDTLITRTVPGVSRAVRWNSAMYGLAGRGWFVSFHVFTSAVKLTFFRGTSLIPVPPGGKSAEGRWVDVHEHDLDEAQVSAWLKQAAALPGWGRN